GNGVDKARDKRDDSQNGEGGQVYAKFKRHEARGLWQKAARGRMAARTWRILPLGSLLQEACYSTSDIVERDPALFLGGEANGGRQTLDL
ncbi:hypothetical protein A259_32826, partial [Pseudomonas syringae pv. actinidiae ICMP 19070]